MATSYNVNAQISAVFSAANKLRGTYTADKYRDVIIPMIILRRVECALDPTRDAVVKLFEDKPDTPDAVARKTSGLPFYNRSRWTLEKVIVEPKVAAALTAYIDSFSPNIKQIFADLEFDKEITKMQKGQKLTSICRQFSELDLDPSRVDNTAMGYMFEEIIRRFSENAEAGDHYTPREVVRLLVRLALAEGCEDLNTPGRVVKVLDNACGTGGMLSTAQAELAKEYSDLDIYLYGQEVIPESHAICLADMLIKGQHAESIKLANTLIDDCFPGDKMRFCLVNPPFGTPWGGKDAAEGVEKSVVKYSKKGQRFGHGLPAKSDSQMLFMQAIIDKLDPTCGRTCVISNGSPLFSGNTGSGESQIRRWLLESDLIEAIVALPEQLFYNTGIGIYVWVISMHKRPERIGKVQLINATDEWEPMRKSLGCKRRLISEEQIGEIVDIYADFKETERSHIFDNDEFIYQEYVVRQPLQRSYCITDERIDDMCAAKFMDGMHNPAKLEELEEIDERDLTAKQRKDRVALERAEVSWVEIVSRLRDAGTGEIFYAAKEFIAHLDSVLSGVPDYRDGETSVQRKAVFEKLAFAMSIVDHDAPIQKSARGKVLYDEATKDTELIKQNEDPKDYFTREVEPYVVDGTVMEHEEKFSPKGFDPTCDLKIGAEIPFTRYFYKYEEPKPSKELLDDFFELEDELNDVLKGLR